MSNNLKINTDTLTAFRETAREFTLADVEQVAKDANLRPEKKTEFIRTKIGAHVIHATREVSPRTGIALKIAIFLFIVCNLVPLIPLILDHGVTHAAHWWEMIALASTGLVCAIIYAVDFQEISECEERHEAHGRPASVLLKQYGLTALLLFASAIGTFFLWKSSPIPAELNRGGPKPATQGGWSNSDIFYLMYLFCVALVGWLFTVIDRVIGKGSTSYEETEEAALSQTFASLPAFYTYGALLGFGILFMFVENGATPNVRLFFGGAAAFQMLISNVTFLAIKRRNVFRRLEEYSRNVRIRPLSGD